VATEKDKVKVMEDIEKRILEESKTQGFVDDFENANDKYIIDYDKSYENNFKNDVRSAVKFYLGLHNDFVGNTFYGFILYPQALNPFLKIMETMGENKNIMVLPAFNHDEYNNAPAYLIIKFDGESKYVTEFETSHI
jgi:hypothetical protein